MEATLNVHVVAGRRLPAADENGTSDPYVCLSVESGNHQTSPSGKSFAVKTHTVKKTLNPLWGEFFDLNSYRPDEEFLRFYVFDHDTFSRDDFLAWGELPLNEIRTAGTMKSKAVKLQDAKGRLTTAGELEVNITYKAKQQPFGAPPQQGGYGAPPPQQGGYGAPPPQQGGYPPYGGYGAPPPQGGYPPYGGYPPQGGYPPYGGYGAPPPQGGYPPYGGYGAPPPQQGGYPPYGGYGAPPPQQGYGAPPPQQGYGAPPPQGYGAPPPQGGGYGAPPPQQGYGAPPPQGYGAPPPQGGGYGAPPPQGGYGAPPPQGGYGAPPPQGQPPQGQNK